MFLPLQTYVTVYNFSSVTLRPKRFLQKRLNQDWELETIKTKYVIYDMTWLIESDVGTHIFALFLHGVYKIICASLLKQSATPNRCFKLRNEQVFRI